MKPRRRIASAPRRGAAGGAPGFGQAGRIIGAGLCLLCAFSAAARGGEPLRDPWQGAPLGAWVIQEVTRSRGGEAPRTVRLRSQVIESDDLGTTLLEETQEREGRHDGPGLLRRPLDARAPGELGMVKTGEQAEELQVSGRKFACQVREYQLADADPAGGTHIRPPGTAPKDAPPETPRARLKVFEAKEALVPFRVLSTLLADIALDPRILRVEWELQHSTSEEKIVSLVTDLQAKARVKEQDLPCVVERLEYSGRQGRRSSSGTRLTWRSEAVPGREVKSETSAFEDGATVRRVEAVADFHAAPPAELTGGRPATPERLPHPYWAEWGAGAWNVSAYVSPTPAGLGTTCVRETALGLTADGSLLLERVNVAGLRAGRRRHALLRARPSLVQSGPPRSVRREELEIAGRRLNCQAREYLQTDEEGVRSTLTVFSCDEVKLPVRGREHDSPLDEHTVKLVQEQEWPDRSVLAVRAVLDLDYAVEIRGRRVRGLLEESRVETRRKAAPGGQAPEPEVIIERMVSSAEVPGHLLCAVRLAGSPAVEQSVSAVLRFGSARDPDPGDEGGQGLAVTAPLGGAPFVNDPWYGFPAGAWVESHSERIRPGLNPQTWDERETVVQTSWFGVANRTRERRFDKNWFFAAPEGPSEFAAPLSRMATEPAGAPRQEALQIGGRKLTCRVTTWRLQSAEGSQAEVTVWEQNEVRLPRRDLAVGRRRVLLDDGTLRMDATLTAPKVRYRHSRRVSKLEEEQVVEGRKVACLVEQRELETEQEGRRMREEETRWSSPAVPGLLVRSRLTTTSPEESVTLTFQVKDFRAAPEQGGAGERAKAGPWLGCAPGARARYLVERRFGGETRQARLEYLAEQVLPGGKLIARVSTGEEPGGALWTRNLVQAGASWEELGMTRTETHKGEHELDGKKIPCQVVCYRLPGGPDGSLEARVWWSEEAKLPVRCLDHGPWRFRLEPQVLRALVTVFAGGEPVTVDRKAARFSEKVQAAGEEWECLRELQEVSVASRTGPPEEQRMQIWISPRFPGGAIKTIFSQKTPAGELLQTTLLDSFTTGPEK